MWTGYDCPSRCSHGDYMGRSPRRWRRDARCQTNLDGGSFQLSFRGQLTRDILFNASVDTLQERSRRCPTSARCRSRRLPVPQALLAPREYDNVITIEFTSEVKEGKARVFLFFSLLLFFTSVCWTSDAAPSLFVCLFVCLFAYFVYILPTKKLRPASAGSRMQTLMATSR